MLNPQFAKKRWTAEEDATIIEMHNKFGSKWELVARYLPGRTQNGVKNRFNHALKQRVHDGAFHN